MVGKPSKEKLYEEYNRDDATLSSVSVIFGVSRPTLKKWLVEYNISLKDTLEVKRLTNKKPKIIQNRVKFAHEKLSNKEWLIEQRINLKKSKELIAKEINCSITLVQKYLDKYNVAEFKLNESNFTMKKMLDKNCISVKLISTEQVRARV